MPKLGKLLLISNKKLVVGLTHSLFGGNKLMKIVVFSGRQNNCSNQLIASYAGDGIRFYPLNSDFLE
jgi:hypothetical protein